MAILVPERFGHEFICLLPDGEGNELWLSDFLDSLSWRGPSSFNAESSEILKKAQHVSYGGFLNALITIATIPSHPYNANFLDERLKRMPLPDRELAWTIPMSRDSIRGGSRGAALITRWAFSVPLDLVSDEQAALVGRVLAWLCSSNHRALRFRATVAAIRLLAGRSSVVAQLVRDEAEWQPKCPRQRGERRRDRARDRGADRRRQGVGRGRGHRGARGAIAGVHAVLLLEVVGVEGTR